MTLPTLGNSVVASLLLIFPLLHLHEAALRDSMVQVQGICNDLGCFRHLMWQLLLS